MQPYSPCLPQCVHPPLPPAPVARPRLGPQSRLLGAAGPPHQPRIISIFFIRLETHCLLHANTGWLRGCSHPHESSYLILQIRDTQHFTKTKLLDLLQCMGTSTILHLCQAGSCGAPGYKSFLCSPFLVCKKLTSFSLHEIP